MFLISVTKAMYLHLSSVPIPPLKDGMVAYSVRGADLYGKPKNGIWFAPDLLWVKRMNRDQQWKLNADAGESGGFPYTLAIFEKVISNTAVVTDPPPPAKNVGVKPVLHMYSLPVKNSLTIDASSPSPVRILHVTMDTLGKFEDGFNTYLRAKLIRPDIFVETVNSYLSNSGFQARRPIRPTSYITSRTGITDPDLLIKAAFLTKVRELGGDVDATYQALIPDRIYGSSINLIKTRVTDKPGFKSFFGVPPSGIKATQMYPFPSEGSELFALLDPLFRPPKDAIVPLEDDLDRILSFEYGKYMNEVIVKQWGGIYYDPSLFPVEPTPWIVPKRNNFAKLYESYPPLKRFPFLMWLEVASGCVWNPKTIFGTESLTPLCLVGVANNPPTEDESGNIVVGDPTQSSHSSAGTSVPTFPRDSNIFVAGIAVADNSVFFYRTGRIETTGGRRRTRRHQRLSRKKRHVF